jgi:hypothetical protein
LASSPGPLRSPVPTPDLDREAPFAAALSPPSPPPPRRPSPCRHTSHPSSSTGTSTSTTAPLPCRSTTLTAVVAARAPMATRAYSGGESASWVAVQHLPHLLHFAGGPPARGLPTFPNLLQAAGGPCPFPNSSGSGRGGSSTTSPCPGRARGRHGALLPDRVGLAAARHGQPPVATSVLCTKPAGCVPRWATSGADLAE